MIKPFQKRNNVWILIPAMGSVLFILFYVVATFFYPGGSQADRNAPGFSWINNYWCNLLNEYAMNGEPNPAKPIALTGMFVLCLSLAAFWVIFPKLMNIQKTLKLTIQISGVISMTFACFLFTQFDHDLITNLASAFGLFAIIGTLISLYKAKYYSLLLFGLLNLFLVLVNTIVYYNQSLIIYLPVIQKFSFASFLVWICYMNIILFRRSIDIDL
ncbi:MAG: hypothetical protein JNJ58_13010 [Chitinophagaceae bacterium]|nr:hypothetical protein [Chitinophagaceae bacterium]